jgi:hypothetical protein
MNQAGADPIGVIQELWPHIKLYDKQKETVYSVWDNRETVVPAGNMLGKDFIAGYIVVVFFLTRYPCRIVTTSTKDLHLNVLWGEINRAIQSSRFPLQSTKGGPLLVNHHEIRRIRGGERSPLCYVLGMVASPDTAESFQGHHVPDTGDGIPRTLFIGDEASSLPDSYKTMAQTWAKRMLFIGNPWPCENFFKKAVKGDPANNDNGGDHIRPDGKGYYRKVIRITAEDSPNVKYALYEKSKGIEPTGRMLIPGVKSWQEYQDNLATWDELQQQVGLRAEFPEDSATKLIPEKWLDLAELRAAGRPETYPGLRRVMAVDSAMGGDNTSWLILNEMRVLFLRSKRTSDTSVITGDTIGLINEWRIDPEDVIFDAGGGGKPHADRLRSQGYKVATVAFGSSATPALHNGLKPLGERREEVEVRQVYLNKRAEMYGILRQRLNPSNEQPLLGIPKEILNKETGPGGRPSLRNQLKPIPLEYDSEGRLKLRSKNKKSPTSQEQTLIDMIGCSPDEADSLAMATYWLVMRRMKRLLKSMI